MVPRRSITIDDASGPVRVKIADRPKGQTAKAEADDVAHADGIEGRAELRKSAAERALKTSDETS